MNSFNKPESSLKLVSIPSFFTTTAMSYGIVKNPDSKKIDFKRRLILFLLAAEPDFLDVITKIRPFGPDFEAAKKVKPETNCLFIILLNKWLTSYLENLDMEDDGITCLILP